MSTQTEQKISIRWLIRRDMPDVLAIESECFEFAWTEEDFLHALRQRNCIGMVAERDGRIVGFMVYELERGRLDVLNLAVAADEQRSGVGRAMVQKLIDKLSSQRRTMIDMTVRETNLDAQLFLKQMGFLADHIIQGWYDETDEDAYVFRHTLADGNRIRQYFSAE